VFKTIETKKSTSWQCLKVPREIRVALAQPE